MKYGKYNREDTYKMNEADENVWADLLAQIAKFSNNAHINRKLALAMSSLLKTLL